MAQSNKGEDPTVAVANDTERALRHFPIDKKDLVALVQCYKSRTYDEDIVGVTNAGGKFRIFALTLGNRR